jgi:hypothetical protein
VALEQVDRCASAGLPIVELTTTTDDWADAVRQVRAAWPSLVVGVGTVLEPKQAEGGEMAEEASSRHRPGSPKSPHERERRPIWSPAMPSSTPTW